MNEFKIDDDYIELIKLLKAYGFCDTGGQAKLLIENELVKVDGNIETRKRFKVKRGMVISYQDTNVRVI